MLKYSEKALYGLVAIHHRSNDINIFVEDTTSENYYRAFITRLLDNRVKIQKIFQCGGRLGVIRAAEDQKLLRYKPAFFLVDGDLFLLCGEKYRIPPNVFVLDAYCIENLLVCPEGILSIAYESETKMSAHQLKGQLKVTSWLKHIASAFYPLFIWYAVAMKLGAQAKTVSVSGMAYFENNSCTVDKEAVSQRIAALRSTLLTEFNPNDVIEVHKEIFKTAQKNTNRLRYISAKNYILPLLARHLRKTCSFKDEHGLGIRLAHKCSFNFAGPLKNALLACLNRSADDLSTGNPGSHGSA